MEGEAWGEHKEVVGREGRAWTQGEGWGAEAGYGYMGEGWGVWHEHREGPGVLGQGMNTGRGQRPRGRAWVQGQGMNTGRGQGCRGMA